MSAGIFYAAGMGEHGEKAAACLASSSRLLIAYIYKDSKTYGGGA